MLALSLKSHVGPEFMNIDEIEWKMKWDLPVSRSLIKILSNQYSGTKDLHAHPFLSPSPYLGQQSALKSDGKLACAISCKSFVPEYWFDRILIKLQLTGKSRLIFHSISSIFMNSGPTWDFRERARKYKIGKATKNFELINEYIYCNLKHTCNMLYTVKQRHGVIIMIVCHKSPKETVTEKCFYLYPMFN